MWRETGKATWGHRSMTARGDLIGQRMEGAGLAGRGHEIISREAVLGREKPQTHGSHKLSSNAGHDSWSTFSVPMQASPEVQVQKGGTGQDHRGLTQQTKEFGFYPISIRELPRFFSSQNRDWKRSDVIRGVVQNNKTDRNVSGVSNAKYHL